MPLNWSRTLLHVFACIARVFLKEFSNHNNHSSFFQFLFMFQKEERSTS